MKRKDLINIQVQAIEQIKNGNELKVYLAVVYYTTDPGSGAQVSLSTLSKELNLDTRTITKALYNLTQAGLIVTTKTPGRINIYGICDLSNGSLYIRNDLTGTAGISKRSRTPGDQAGKSCKGQQKQQKRKESAKNTTKTEKEVKA